MADKKMDEAMEKATPAKSKADLDFENELIAQGYKKIEAGDTWDFNKDKVMQGLLVSKEENVGPNESNLYSFEVDGQIISVWGSAIIDTRLKNAGVGELVTIIYYGKMVSPKTKREYKHFEVYHKEVNGAEV